MLLSILVILFISPLFAEENVFHLREVLRSVPYSYEFAFSWERERELHLWKDPRSAFIGKGVEIGARLLREWDFVPLPYARPLPIQIQGLVLAFYDSSFEVPTTGFLADLHVHSLRSHDSTADLESIFREAERMGLKALAITDHDTFTYPLAIKVYDRLVQQGRLQGNLILIPGEEITTRDGHILALFIHAPIPPGLSAQETIALIHGQGGIAVAAHPHHRTGVGEILVRALPFDLREQKNPATLIDSPVGYILDDYHTGIGVSDAHDPELVGLCATWFPEEVSRTPQGIKEALLSKNFRAVCTKEVMHLLVSFLSFPLLYYPFLALEHWVEKWEFTLERIFPFLSIQKIEILSTLSPWFPPEHRISLFDIPALSALAKPLRFLGIRIRTGFVSLTILRDKTQNRMIMIEITQSF